MLFSKNSLSLKTRIGLGLSAAAIPLAAVAPASIASATSHPRTTDWANSSFCASYHVPYMGTTFNGVAACGQPFNAGGSNEQGKISYNGVTFNSVGFQCVEVAARYFYWVTGHTPAAGDGSDYAWDLYKAYPQYKLAPAGEYGGTGTFSSTITPGSIISMWDTSDETPGHVAVVMSVSVNSAGNGEITVLEENASASGTGVISVSDDHMTFENGGFNIFQWLYGLPPVGGSPPPSYYVYNVSGVAPGTLHERSGPGTSYAIVGNLANGAAIDIVCQTTGTDVKGTDIWDKLTNGSYVSDDYTTTPNFDTWSPPIPHPC
ncbi:MAG TPA: CHAP domain-containing protein [Acidimicrobiales bacterium]|jgi:surface antigen|nr:CHAP domain-containing protein [Acidimicrobiales bacterium]